MVYDEHHSHSKYPGLRIPSVIQGRYLVEHQGRYLVELTPWKLSHGTYTMEVTS